MEPGAGDGAPSPVRASLVDAAPRKRGAAEKDLLPQTGDGSLGGVAVALASVGAALAAAGSKLRRREE
jgi:LPXTG-motif cell wall-anchored protein